MVLANPEPHNRAKHQYLKDDAGSDANRKVRGIFLIRV
jgi:hypothetical protein